MKTKDGNQLIAETVPKLLAKLAKAKVLPEDEDDMSYEAKVGKRNRLLYYVAKENHHVIIFELYACTNEGIIKTILDNMPEDPNTIQQIFDDYDGFEMTIEETHDTDAASNAGMPIKVIITYKPYR